MSNMSNELSFNVGDFIKRFSLCLSASIMIKKEYLNLLIWFAKVYNGDYAI